MLPTYQELGWRGHLLKGDVTPYEYYVKWVTREREGSKISKNWWRHLCTAPLLFYYYFTCVIIFVNRPCVPFVWTVWRIWSFCAVMEPARCVETECQNVPFAEKQWKDGYYCTEFLWFMGSNIIADIYSIYLQPGRAQGVNDTRDRIYINIYLTHYVTSG